MPVYCITGTNRGLGLEFVRQLARSSDNTIIAGVRSLASTDLSDLRAAASPSTHILECDTGSLASIHAFAKAARLALGEDRKIDYLINNAAVNLASHQTSLNLGPDELQAQMAVNVIGPAKTLELFLDAGLLSRDVRVLNMTSGLASLHLTAQSPARKCAGYSITKAALNMLTLHQAADLRSHLPGAVVVLADPGWAKTRLGGEGAVMEPSDSVAGVLKVLHGLRPEDSGSFFSHSGDKIPW
ncbi:NAD(P)-binding protein [Thermothelomyces heterothallicus CBS 203.75]